MRDRRFVHQLLRAIPAVVMAVGVLPVLGWLLWEGGLRRLRDVVALGVFAYILLRHSSVTA